MADRYTYPGSEVLVNLLGISDQAQWKLVETAVIGQRLVESLLNPIAGRFDFQHLGSIHRHLTRDLYSWGGQLRQTDTRPAGTGIAHCRPQFIAAEAERIFTALAEMNLLCGRDADAFSTGLAWVWGETTALHPFRDVNTRSQFVFFTHLAEHAGWVVDWRQIDPYVFAHARTVAIAGDETGIDALLYPALLTVDQARQADDLADRVRRSTQEFFTRDATPRSPATLHHELGAARRRRHRPRRS